MTPWSDLFRRPPRLTAHAVEAWFARIADCLLNNSQLVIAGKPLRLVDIEFYYRGPGHVDPFAHAHPIQAQTGRWYFHKTGNGYRGGSFKGLDLTFGDGEARGGILFRAAATAEGMIVDGPSLLVDRALRLSGVKSVAELDRKIAQRAAWQPDSPIHLRRTHCIDMPFLACARVGLSLRRAGHFPDMPEFLTRHYRFVTEPRAIAKGKVQMVVALHRRGLAPSQIHVTTGCPLRAIERYVAAHATGRSAGRFDSYFGKVLSATDICRLHGIADRG
jgi:hypothetical protein